MSLSERLRAEASEVWEKCFEHPFVQGIGRGDLDEDRFRRFLLQDYLFLVDYARALAFASAKAPDLDAQSWFAKLLHATHTVEMEGHRRLCADWGIASTDLERTEALPTTVAYASFLVRRAAAGDVGELAASLLPCQWGYADIGRRLKEQGLPAHDRFAEWIESYADPDYQALTDWLRGFVDELGAGIDEGISRRWSRTFQTTLRYEFAFWEMAWAGEDWPV